STSSRGQGSQGGRGKRGAGSRPGWLPDPPPPAPARRGGKAGTAPPGGLHDPYAQREAERYERPIPSREAILQLLADADGPLTGETIAAQLGLAGPDRVEALGKRLAAMVRDGQLLQNRRGGYVPVQRLDLV